MKICGIELKGNDAILVSVNMMGDTYEILESNVKKINLTDTDSQADVKAFANTVYSYLEAQSFEAVAIKARAKKGKFAGGSVSFKIEGIIQNGSIPVYLFSGAKMKSKLKNMEIDSSRINAYQLEALKAAICLSMDLAK